MRSEARKFSLSATLPIVLVVSLLVTVVGCSTDYGPEIDRLQLELEAAEARIDELESPGIRLLVAERKRELARPALRELVRELAECEVENFFADSAAYEDLVDEMEKEVWVNLDPYDPYGETTAEVVARSVICEW